jgi:hypothetical protein
MVAAVVVPAVIGGMAFSSRAGGKPIAWQDYVSEQGAYAAQFPGEPRESQQSVAGPDGTSVDLHVVEVDLGRNGHYGVVEREGPKLTYESGDRRELYDIDSNMIIALKGSPYDSKMPYPAAWGEVACTELHGHLNQDAEQELIVRSWRTGAHQYSAVAAYRKSPTSEAVAQQFLDSIRPIGDYKRPASLSSGSE